MLIFIMNDDPLKELLLDPEGVAREDLANALRPFVQFDADGGLWLHDQFDQLSSEDKVICLLLANRAQQLLGLREDGGATPQQLIDMGQMAGGTVRPKLSKLLKERKIAKSGSEYHLPPPAIRRAVTRLREAAVNV